GPEGLMSMTVPGVDGSKTWTPLTARPSALRSERTLSYGCPLYCSGIRLMVSGVDVVGVGVAEVSVGLGLAEVGGALETWDGGVVPAGAGLLGENNPDWVRSAPTRASNTSTISAMSGHVHGLRFFRGGSCSWYSSSSWMYALCSSA